MKVNYNVFHHSFEVCLITRQGFTRKRTGAGIQVSRMWTNYYHQYAAHAAFVGFLQNPDEVAKIIK